MFMFVKVKVVVVLGLLRRWRSNAASVVSFVCVVGDALQHHTTHIIKNFPFS